MRKGYPARLASVVLALVVAFLLVGVAAEGAAAETPRCCIPKTGHGGLPLTGLPLYLPVLLSLGLVGAGLVLRRRAREQL